MVNEGHVLPLVYVLETCSATSQGVWFPEPLCPVVNKDCPQLATAYKNAYRDTPERVGAEYKAALCPEGRVKKSWRIPAAPGVLSDRLAYEFVQTIQERYLQLAGRTDAFVKPLPPPPHPPPAWSFADVPQQIPVNPLDAFDQRAREEAPPSDSASSEDLPDLTVPVHNRNQSSGSWPEWDEVAGEFRRPHTGDYMSDPPGIGDNQFEETEGTASRPTTPVAPLPPPDVATAENMFVVDRDLIRAQQPESCKYATPVYTVHGPERPLSDPDTSLPRVQQQQHAAQCEAWDKLVASGAVADVIEEVSSYTGPGMCVIKTVETESKMFPFDVVNPGARPVSTFAIKHNTIHHDLLGKRLTYDMLIPEFDPETHAFTDLSREDFLKAYIDTLTWGMLPVQDGHASYDAVAKNYFRSVMFDFLRPERGSARDENEPVRRHAADEFSRGTHGLSHGESFWEETAPD